MREERLNVGRYFAALVIALTLGIGVIVGTLVSRGVRADRRVAVAPDAKILTDPSPVALSGSFAKIAAKVSPAVVNINTKSTVRFQETGPGDPSDKLFRRFFQFGPGEGPNDMQQESLGSGVILDKNGYVLTNYHVIVQDDGEPVDSIQVVLPNQGDFAPGYRARIIGYDQWTDLAVIKIDAGRPLPAAQLGNSDSMQVGDWVLAIGSPFGLRTTVTAGIISAKGREMPGTDAEFKRFLQTDAAINPGNSGGPLVNLAGQVVGINTAIATNHGTDDGVGFAIPSQIARGIYNDIITTGTVRRGAIGVTFSPNQNAALLRSFGASYGVVVQTVEHGSPAERAGLKMGDVITAINSQHVYSGSDLLRIVSNTAPGSKLRVDYVRDRKAARAEVVVGDWNQIAEDGMGGPSAPLPENKPADKSGGVLGLSVRALTAQTAQDVSKQLDLSQPQGVLVTEVTPGGFADNLPVPVQQFDILLSINHTAIRSVDDFNRMESELKPGQDVLFLIAERDRGGYTTQYVADRLPQP
jgi:serine protease Do